MMRLNVSLSVAASIVLPLLVGGCSTTTLSDAAALGSVGQTTASSMQQAAQLSPSLLKQLTMSDAFMKSLRGSAPNETQVRLIQTELTARSTVLGKLSGAYAALAGLAGNQAGSNFEMGCTALTASIQAYTVATKIQPVSEPAAAETCTVGGLIAGAIQEHQVKEASDKLLPLLRQVIQSFEANGQLYKDFDESVADQASKATLELYNSGFYTVTPLLTTLGAPYGLAPVANADALLHQKDHKSYLEALQAVGRDQIAQNVSSIGAAYDASLAALKKLQAQQQAFHDGKPVDLSLLLADVNYVQTVTNQIIGALNAKPPTGK